MKNSKQFVAPILSAVVLSTGFLFLNAKVCADDWNSRVTDLGALKSIDIQVEKRFESLIEDVGDNLFVTSLKMKTRGVCPMARINPGAFRSIFKIAEHADKEDSSEPSILIAVIIGAVTIITLVRIVVNTIADKIKLSPERNLSSRKNRLKIATLQSAAEAGDGDSAYSLGIVYRNGEDEKKAAEWFQKAADLGNREAMFELAYCLGGGRGIDADETKALEWLKRSAELGHGEAAYQLGVWNENGIFGVKKDVNQAKIWFGKAAALGNKRAIEKLNEYNFQ